MRKLPDEVRIQRERDRARKYYLANKTKIDRYRRKWAADNSEKEKEYKATWLKQNLAWYYSWEKARHPSIRLAYSQLRYALKSGKIKRLPCETCGHPKSHAHHHDYSKPLDVQWFCAKHHKDQHNMKNKTVRLKSQQGDILLRKLPSIPVGERKTVSKGKCVLAHGESGHSHVVDQDDAELISIGERMILTIESNASVVHDEHHAQQLSPGIWEIGRVVEYDYFSKMQRQVVD